MRPEPSAGRYLCHDLRVRPHTTVLAEPQWGYRGDAGSMLILDSEDAVFPCHRKGQPRPVFGGLDGWDAVSGVSVLAGDEDIQACLRMGLLLPGGPARKEKDNKRHVVLSQFDSFTRNRFHPVHSDISGNHGRAPGSISCFRPKFNPTLRARASLRFPGGCKPDS